MLDATRAAAEVASARPALAPVPAPTPRTIVVGGGCAGLALAVAMIDAGGDLTVLDAGHYPWLDDEDAFAEALGEALTR